MKKLKAWLEKNDISFTPATYGSCYFNRATYICEGALITLGRKGDLTAVHRYAERHGYSLFGLRRGADGLIVNIVRTEDFTIFSKIEEFVAKSVAQCEMLIHEHHMTHGNEAGQELNDKLARVMAGYEEEYYASLRAAG